MKKDPGNPLGRPPLLVIAAMVTLLAACGGSTGVATPAPTIEATAPTLTAAPTSVPAAAPAEAVAPAPESPQGVADDDLLALGKEVFEKTAGGVGCAWCHGLNGEGDGPSGMGAPANRGATEERFRWALEGGETDAMLFLKLKKKEIKAVLAYLQYLGEQP